MGEVTVSVSSLPSPGPLRFQDRVAVITGGSKGIGEGCVRVFVRNGGKVVFCARGEKEGRRLEKEMNETGPGAAYFVTCDVTDEAQIKNVIDKTVEKYGRIDCLINNAGAHPDFVSIDDYSADEFRKLLNLNLVSYFIASKYALPHLRKTKGSIINDSSLVAQIGQVGSTAYVASKGAITAMSKAMAVDEARYEVRVNSISPGNIWTPMWDNGATSTGDPDGTIKAGKEAQLLGRFGTIEECGQACLFLAAEGTFITGVDLPLSGGAELSYGRKTRLDDASGSVYN